MGAFVTSEMDNTAIISKGFHGEFLKAILNRSLYINPLINQLS